MQKVQVLHVTRKAGKSKKTGNDYSMDVVQVVITEDGVPPFVGEIVLPKDHPEVKPGIYTTSLKLVRSFDGKVLASVTQLHPLAAVKAA